MFSYHDPENSNQINAIVGGAPNNYYSGTNGSSQFGLYCFDDLPDETCLAMDGSMH